MSRMHSDIAEFMGRARRNLMHKKRRSKGIVNISVTYLPRKIELWDLAVSSKKTDEVFVLPGKYPLTHLSNNGYEANVPLPNGHTVRILVINKYVGWVSISAPGSAYHVTCQVGRQSAP